MSRAGLEKFYTFMMDSKECQAKVKSFGGDADALAAYAREVGYDFSAEDLREYQDKAQRVLENRMQKKLCQPEATLAPGVREFCALIKLAESDEETAKRLEELNTGTLEELIAFARKKGSLLMSRTYRLSAKISSSRPTS